MAKRVCYFTEENGVKTLTKEGHAVQRICDIVQSAPTDDGWQGIAEMVRDSLPGFYENFQRGPDPTFEKFVLKVQNIVGIGVKIGVLNESDKPVLRAPGISTADLLDF